MSGYPRLDETGLNTLAEALADATKLQGVIKVCETEAEWDALSQSEKDDPNTYWVRPWADTVAFATDKTPVGAVLSVATGKASDGITDVGDPPNKFPTADYLVCNGQTVPPSEYPALAAYFQTRYGSTYYFGGTAPGNFSLPNWSSDFPSNGVLVMKARESSNTITFAEIDDTSVSEDKLWSSSKIDGEIDALKSDIVSEIVNVSGTTAVNGGINVQTNFNYTTGSIYAMSNISDDNTKNYRITVAGKPYANAVTLRYRNTADNSALANTSVSDKVLIIGKLI